MENKQNMFNVNIPITYDHLLTLFSDADSGASYWAEIEYGFPKSCDHTKGLSYEERLIDFVMNQGGMFKIIDFDEDETHLITKANVINAIQKMCVEYPEHFANLINENDDAETGDVFFQLMCFNEVVYG